MLADGCLTVPKIGRVTVRQSQEVEGTAKSATFKRDACGHWFVSLVAECEMPVVALPLPSEDRTMGVDVGLKDAVVTSDGERVTRHASIGRHNGNCDGRNAPFRAKRRAASTRRKRVRTWRASIRRSLTGVNDAQEEHTVHAGIASASGYVHRVRKVTLFLRAHARSLYPYFPTFCTTSCMSPCTLARALPHGLRTPGSRSQAHSAHHSKPLSR